MDIIFNWDHFFPLSGENTASTSSAGPCWAPGPSRPHGSQLGALVTCNSYRNPELLADMARTVDHISDGRLVLGIGSGWKELDYTEYGYEFGTAGQQAGRSRRGMPRIEARFGKLNPEPTRKIPVLIGGGGEHKTLRLVAKHADIWHSFARGDDFDRKKQVLAQHCADVGRDPGEIELSVGVGGEPEVNGPALLDKGITMFTIGASGPDFDLSRVRAWVGLAGQTGRLTYLVARSVRRRTSITCADDRAAGASWARRGHGCSPRWTSWASTADPGLRPTSLNSQQRLCEPLGRAGEQDRRAGAGGQPRGSGLSAQAGRRCAVACSPGWSRCSAGSCWAVDGVIWRWAAA